MSLAELKKTRQQSLEIAKEGTRSERSENRDERFWRPILDDAGNGNAIIRFLPSPDEGALPWAKFWDHFFKGPTGRYYAEKSRTSLGKGNPDPVSEYNSRLWNAGQQDEARKQRRRLAYICNILVINDPAKPENNGKVFLYRFGAKIFDMRIKPLLKPDESDQALGVEASNPFDLWEGRNFKLKVKQVGGFANYDESQFGNQVPAAKTDDELDAIWKQVYSLKEFTDPDTFKSYAELKVLFDEVMGFDTASGTASREIDPTTIPVGRPPKVESIVETGPVTPAATVAKAASKKNIDLDALLKGLDGDE